MANIKVTLDYSIINGQSLTFQSPCDYASVEGLSIYYPDINTGNEISKTFIFRDSHGNDLTDINSLFVSGVYIKVLLDTVNGYAYIQNADTNAYLEAQLASKAPAYGYGPDDLVSGVSKLKTGTLYFVHEQ
jgi:hypothetical protein